MKDDDEVVHRDDVLRTVRVWGDVVVRDLNPEHDSSINICENRSSPSC
jgi:hypothetical protein